jgi:hypothetical protein
MVRFCVVKFCVVKLIHLVLNPIFNEVCCGGTNLLRFKSQI